MVMTAADCVQGLAEPTLERNSIAAVMGEASISHCRRGNPPAPTAMTES